MKWKSKIEPLDNNTDNVLYSLRNKLQAESGSETVIAKKEFVSACVDSFGLKQDFFAVRTFELFDKNNDGEINIKAFIEGIKQFTQGTPKQKMKFIFDIYDTDGSGDLDHSEIKEVLQHCTAENRMNLSDEAFSSLTQAIFDLAETENTQGIPYEKFYSVLERHPSMLNSLMNSITEWITPTKMANTTKGFTVSFYFTRKYIVNNRKHLIWTTLYMIINIALFLTYMRHTNLNFAGIIARGCGMCLNFNTVAVTVLMLRHTLTWLRMTKLRYFLPIEAHINYHKFIGYIIVLQSIVHTIAHLVNIGLIVADNESTTNHSAYFTTTVPRKELQYWEFLFTLKSKIGLEGQGFAYLSGIVLFAILAVMFICALPVVRNNGYFQVFYYSHLLYIVYWIFLSLHSPVFGYMFIIPGSLVLIEKIAPKIHQKATKSKFYITQVKLLPSKVIQLIISKPKMFKFKPGDYIFITIPAVAKFERHPFTISSAPEHEGEFSLHIRSCGSWTASLYKYFEEYSDSQQDPTEILVTECFTEDNTAKVKKRIVLKKNKDQEKTGQKIMAVNIQVYIEGPYGSPAREIVDANHVVLISCGIGVTPYAAILQSIMYQHQYSSDTATVSQGSSVQSMKKVDFIWINRDNRCFEWFVSLLAEIEIQQEQVAETFLNIRLYLTSALSVLDIKGYLLQMAMDEMQKNGNRNVVTGLKSSFKPGRPDWHELFADIKRNKAGDVGVFFCGSPLLAKTIKYYCDLHGFKFSREQF